MKDFVTVIWLLMGGLYARWHPMQSATIYGGVTSRDRDASYIIQNISHV